MVSLESSLDQLENTQTGPPPYPSHLVTTCHQLRQKPLKDFTTEDLRIMIGQNIALQFLVPLALVRLEMEPLAEGDYYPGDLASAVLSVETLFWAKQSSLRARAAQIAERALKLADALKEHASIREALAAAMQRFRKSSA